MDDYVFNENNSQIKKIDGMRTFRDDSNQRNKGTAEMEETVALDSHDIYRT